jgi:hypothetical protein
MARASALWLGADVCLTWVTNCKRPALLTRSDTRLISLLIEPGASRRERSSSWIARQTAQTGLS